MVSLELMLMCGRALSCRMRTLSIGKLVLTHLIFALNFVRVSMYALEFVSPLGKKSTRKNCQQNFIRQGYMLSFENPTLLFREIVKPLRSTDVIHRRLASFWCMIHVPVLVIIPVLKKKALLFDSPLYLYFTF